ncbi:glycerol kinase GlpK [Solirubrobacter sp. CPCC 204708]|uniref:Glycerol kinase n=1 Tax=Solirubrobacter deserti TaxID=2282478 RepID=A0ABT4RUL8_9ACTN|nr:glycerol kinase GlpK [Solirubrobacter deserti]MBE2320966.1 glycerol kinase GlpK [Solirubrobacter deserti]MDA0142260.1 glycerol kinase GlpK [Solirubrobacter deserti]
MADYIGAIDQGTTSTRFIVFDKDGNIVTVDQREHEQITPKAGWVEHDAKEVWRRTREVIGGALANSDLEAGDIAAVGITNQRETTVVWDRETGEPVYNAIVWQDTRTDQIVRELGDADQLRDVTGLPLSTYFSGPKIKWILDNVDGARERAEKGELAFGTMDSWVVWNLTGGEQHITDVTNASRTLLMNLETLDWHEPSLELLGIPRSMLPEIKSSSEAYGDVKGTAIGGTPIAGILGDQQAALFGQTCFDRGDAKNTYGTGSFLLVNTGEEIVQTEKLLTTAAYKLGDGKAAYALEGSIAVTGALIQWLRDRLKIIDSAPEVQDLAKTVDDNGGVYFVPAFSGLFAPYWRDDARGVIVGLTAYANRGHIARAALEAAAWQSREVVDAANAVADVPFTDLRVDGGMTGNDLLMQFQADVLGVPVIRPKVTETTALGAAYAAGLATGFWASQDELRERWAEDKRWEPQMDEGEREAQYARWKKAVERSLDWTE